MIVAIDPGNKKSAVVCLGVKGFARGCESLEIDRAQVMTNESLIAEISRLGAVIWTNAVLAIEIPSPRGQAMSWQLVDTIKWAGRFIQAWHNDFIYEVDRKDVKLMLTGKAAGKDKNVRQGIIELYRREWTGQIGGGREPMLGLKSRPGPLFGMGGDKWAALGVALYHRSKHPQTVGALDIMLA